MEEEQDFEIIQIITDDCSDNDNLQYHKLRTVRKDSPIIDVQENQDDIEQQEHEDDIEQHEDQDIELAGQLHYESTGQDERANSIEPKSKTKKRGTYKRVNIKKIYKCKECNLKLVKWVDWMAHMKLHRLHKKPYTCDQCQESFKFKSLLKFHMAMHKDIPDKVRCSECEFDCYSSAVLEKHVKSVHTKHVFEGNSIKAVEITKKKVKLKSTEVPLKANFECNICLLCFDLKSEVYAHEKFHSPDKVQWKASVKNLNITTHIPCVYKH